MLSSFSCWRSSPKEPSRLKVPVSLTDNSSFTVPSCSKATVPISLHVSGYECWRTLASSPFFLQGNRFEQPVSHLQRDVCSFCKAFPPMPACKDSYQICTGAVHFAFHQHLSRSFAEILRSHAFGKTQPAFRSGHDSSACYGNADYAFVHVVGIIEMYGFFACEFKHRTRS